MVPIPSLFSRELILAYILTLLGGIIAFTGLVFLPPQIPLWYSLPLAELQLAPKMYLLLLPCLMLTIALLHAIIIGKLRTMDATIIKIFSFGTTLVIFLFFIALTHIVYVLI